MFYHLKISGQGDDCTTDFLLDYPYLKESYKIIAIDLSKQQALDANPKAIQQFNFTGHLHGDGYTTFFIIKESKEIILVFSQETDRVL